MERLPRYRTVASQAAGEITIEKSLFIGYAAPVESEEAALAFVAEIKTKHRDATHNVPAYLLGPRNEIQRTNDDGEPSGTAGLPILEVLRKKDLRDTAIVVTRYFGGIKLGTGGLIRAYTKGALVALEAAGIIERALHRIITVSVAYPLQGTMTHQLHGAGYQLAGTDYDAAVHYHVYVAAEDIDTFQTQCINWTNAQATMTPGEWRYLDTPAE